MNFPPVSKLQLSVVTPSARDDQKSLLNDAVDQRNASRHLASRLREGDGNLAASREAKPGTRNEVVYLTSRELSAEHVRRRYVFLAL